MSNVSIRDLRNSGGEIVDRVTRGEHVTITRSGNPVAELRPLPKPPTSTAELISRRAHLPHVDPVALRSDIDAILDPSL
jgi:prevent-host-death family protein